MKNMKIWWYIRNNLQQKPTIRKYWNGIFWRKQRRRSHVSSLKYVMKMSPEERRNDIIQWKLWQLSEKNDVSERGKNNLIELKRKAFRRREIWKLGVMISLYQRLKLETYRRRPINVPQNGSERMAHHAMQWPSGRGNIIWRQYKLE